MSFAGLSSCVTEVEASSDVFQAIQSDGKAVCRYAVAFAGFYQRAAASSLTKRMAPYFIKLSRFAGRTDVAIVARMLSIVSTAMFIDISVI